MLPKPSPTSPPMFESPFIDRFSRVHPLCPVAFFPVAVLLLWYGAARGQIGILASAVLALAGYTTWTLTEYWLHRTLFHWVPRAPWGERFHFLMHGVHHDWPRDRYRLVMPPAVSITLFWAFLGLFWLALGPWVWPFHAGFAIGYAGYDLTHYYIHHHRPRWAWLKAVRSHHLKHHAPRADHGGKFGVSTTLWDHVFRTY
jgi:sterol desaturase/sphingolipid hydroxylase (fatty acid hydroxylase superfamily)